MPIDIPSLISALENRRRIEQPMFPGGGGGGTKMPPSWGSRPSYPGGATDMSLPPPTSGGGSWPNNPYPISGQPAPTGGGMPGQPLPYQPPVQQGGPSIPTMYNGPGFGARMTGGEITGGGSGFNDVYQSGDRSMANRYSPQTADANRWNNMMQDDDSFIRFLFENDKSDLADKFSSIQDPEQRKAFKLMVKKMMSGVR